MATTQQPTLSDGLAAMIRTIEPTRKTGLVMTRKNVAVFLDGLNAMLDEARHLEAVADREQWNEKARREAQRDRRAALETAIADGTVEILPVVARPTAVRQGGEGGAA